MFHVFGFQSRLHIEIVEWLHVFYDEVGLIICLNNQRMGDLFRILQFLEVITRCLYELGLYKPIILEYHNRHMLSVFTHFYLFVYD